MVHKRFVIVRHNNKLYKFHFFHDNTSFIWLEFVSINKILILILNVYTFIIPMMIVHIIKLRENT